MQRKSNILQQIFTLVNTKHCTYQIKTLHLAFQHLTAVGELCHCSGTAVLPPWENFTTEVTLHCYCRGTALLLQRENFATAVAMQCYCATEELKLLHLSLALQNNIFMCFVSACFLCRLFRGFFIFKNSSFFILHSSFKILTFAENLWNHGLYLRHQAFCHQRWTWHQNNHFHEGLPPALRVVPQP